MLLIKPSPVRCVCLQHVTSRLAFTARRRVLPFSGGHPRDASYTILNFRPVCRGRLQVRASNSAAGSLSNPQDDSPASRQTNSPSWKWVVFGAIAMVAAGVLTATNPHANALKDMLVNGPLGKSGFLAAFSLIFLSEIGDKTFFIAALLAMRLGRWISFLGSVASLTVMTVISVSIGVVFARVPDALKSSVPVGEICGVLLLLYFGYRSLRDAFKTDGNEEDDELADAESAVKEAEKSGRVNIRSPVQSFIEVATLIFVAEWGDRSMLATIALGAAQNPFGVGVGAIVGHSFATGIAVIGGAIASKYVSEKTINLISGLLFLIFAAATAYGMLVA